MRAPLAVFTAVMVISGCGGGSDPATSDDEEQAATNAATTFVDKDDCALATDAFLSDSYALADDARAECERDRTKGLQRGEYSVKSSSVGEDKATVVLDLDIGGTRTFDLIKQGDRWLIDAFSEDLEAPVADLGKPLKYQESFEINGAPIDVRLEITVESLKNIEAPAYYPLGSNARLAEMKVRVNSDSSDSFDLSVPDFELVDTKGRRYPASGNPTAFDPSLGNEVATLAPGDSLTGFAGFEIPKSARAQEIRYSYAGSSQPPLTWSIDR